MRATLTLVGMCIVGAAIGGAALARAQSATGVVANWGDLEVWSRPTAGTRTTAVGLGLHLSGTGTVLISFTGTLDSRSPSAPGEINVVIAPALLSNPNSIRTPTLRFRIEGGERPTTIDLTSNLSVDDPSPGAIIRSAGATMRAADFAKLAQAKTLKAVAFGFDVTFRPDQLKAMIALAERLKLPKSTTP